MKYFEKNAGELSEQWGTGMGGVGAAMLAPIDPATALLSGGVQSGSYIAGRLRRPLTEAELRRQNAAGPSNIIFNGFLPQYRLGRRQATRAAKESKE